MFEKTKWKKKIKTTTKKKKKSFKKEINEKEFLLKNLI